MTDYIDFFFILKVEATDADVSDQFGTVTFTKITGDIVMQANIFF